MPSLFDQISGFQFPDVLMNSGPLPSTAGGPAGSDGSIDGVINGTGALLENITPYAMGRSARTGSDRNYQQIPHRYPYIIPKIWLPRFENEEHIAVSHAVDQGDIAFLLYAGSRAWWTSRDQFAPRAPQCAFAGIDVVNYILACLQASKTERWRHIREDLIKEPEFLRALEALASGKKAKKDADNLLVFQAVRMLVQQLFVPHGICAGSEKQGGQHEHDGGRAVIAPVNFVITMTVDGKNIDLVNYWFDKNMLAGDELIFRLKKQEVRRTFELSAYYKQPQSADVYTGHDCWQLVPDILRQEPQTPEDERCSTENAWFHHKCQGYWRIAQSFQTRAKNNVHAFTRGTPLEVTFAPVWQNFVDCRDAVSHGEHSVVVGSVQHTETAAPKKLYSIASKDSLKFMYGEEKAVAEAFAISSSHTHYTIEFDDKVCKVYEHGRQLTSTKYMIWKDDISCLHVLFHDKEVTSIPQSIKPHVEKKDAKNYEDVDASRLSTYAEAGGMCTNALETKIQQVSLGQNAFEYSVNLIIQRTSTHFYDADFLRTWAERLKWHALAGNYWCKKGTNYVYATDDCKVLVEYVPKPAALSLLALTSSSKTGGSSLAPGTNAVSEEMHFADMSRIGAPGALAALGAEAAGDGEEVAPRAQKRVKKIKFLEPEPGPAPG